MASGLTLFASTTARIGARQAAVRTLAKCCFSHRPWNGCRTALAVTALFFGLSDPGKALAADIYRLRDYCQIMIVGEIVTGDDKVFFDKVMEMKDCDLLGVNLVSSGGDLRVAMEIGILVRALHLTTQAPKIYNQRKHASCSTSRGEALREDENCVCGSACFFIWAAGSERDGTAIYIHRPYIDPKVYRELGYKTAEAYREVSSVARAYLMDMNVPVSVIDRMFALNSTEASQLSAAERELMKIAPYFEELMIANCGVPPAGADRLHLQPKPEQQRLLALRKLHVDCRIESHHKLARQSRARFLSRYFDSRTAREPPNDERK